MKLLKKLMLVLMVTAGLSSCVVYTHGPYHRHYWHRQHWHGGYYGPR